jgi:FMN phosphatase YigB (HAD superfamily)
MEKQLLFIDLDDTLISNQHTKEVLTRCLEEVGFDRQAIIEAYPRAREDDGFFTPTAYLRALTATPEQAARWDLLWHSHKQSLNNGLLPGALTFLQSIDRTKYSPQLLTLGNPAYQEMKVTSLNLHPYFEAEHYCTEEKVDFLLKLIPRETHFVLIDDRSDCTEPVRKSFPHATTYAAFASFPG